MIASEATAQKAAEHLSRADAVLAKIITGRPAYTVRPSTDYYGALVDSIVSQQLSVKAASSIEQRLKDLFGGSDFPSPEQILAKSDEALRSVGLSRPKIRYIQDLARHILAGELKFDHLNKLSNEEIVRELVAVKGIGEWTAHMFLMFCMGRLDVLPVGDLGIRNGIQKLYDLDHSPTPDEIKEIAKENNWHPYESVAAWYIWQSLDNAPNL